MTAFVLDASVAAAWLFDDEQEPRADAALRRLEEHGALVPQLWHSEVRNCVLMAERRGRLTPDSAADRLRALATLPIHTDPDPDLDTALDLARAHGLSFYDALYLELALRHAARLASLDTALLRAAQTEGLRAVD